MLPGNMSYDNIYYDLRILICDSPKNDFKKIPLKVIED